jgi:hypothetical protein
MPLHTDSWSSGQLPKRSDSAQRRASCASESSLRTLWSSQCQTVWALDHEDCGGWSGGTSVSALQLLQFPWYEVVKSGGSLVKSGFFTLKSAFFWPFLRSKKQHFLALFVFSRTKTLKKWHFLAFFSTPCVERGYFWSKIVKNVSGTPQILQLPPQRPNRPPRKVAAE